MAAKGPSVDINYVINCVRCNDEFSSPLLQFNCFCICCSNCLKDTLSDITPGTKFSCPGCKTVTMFQSGGIKGLQDELLQYKVQDVGAIFSNRVPSCNFCLTEHIEKPSVRYCLKCKNYMCDSDAKRHELIPHHESISLEETKSDMYLPEMLVSKEAICKIHSSVTKNLPLEYFCDRCQIPVCQACINTKHKDHKMVLVYEAAGTIREKLEQMTSSVLHLQSLCEGNIEQMTTLMEDIETNGKHCEDECTKWGEKIKQMIDGLVNENVTNIQHFTKSQKVEAQHVQTEQKAFRTQLNSATDYMEVFLKFGSNLDMTQKYQLFKENLQQSLQKNIFIQTSHKRLRFQFSNMQKVKNFVQDNVVLEYAGDSSSTEIIKLEKSNFESKWPTFNFGTGFEVGKETITVAEGKQVRVYDLTGNQKWKLECKHLQEATDVTIYKNDYYITDISKRQILVVTKDGKLRRQLTLPPTESHLSNDLFLAVDKNHGQLYVSSLGTDIVYKCKLDENEVVPFVTDGLNSPRHLCTTNNHELVVCNAGLHTICKYNSKGDILWRYGHEGSGRGQFKEPRGVCIDAWDQIYVADWGNGRIHWVSSKGQFLGFVDTGIKVPHPYAISIHGERLFITSSSAPCQMFVFKLNYTEHVYESLRL